MSATIFEKAPEFEYRRRSWLGRLVRRPKTIAGIVAALVVATVLVVRVTQQLQGNNGHRPAKQPIRQSLTRQP